MTTEIILQNIFYGFSLVLGEAYYLVWAIAGAGVIIIALYYFLIKR